MSHALQTLVDRPEPRSRPTDRDGALLFLVSALKSGGRFLASGIEFGFGLIALVVGLAILAAVPVLQFLSLGYLLEAGGRVARSGRLRDGLIGIRTAARWGGAVLGVWLLLVPFRVLALQSRAVELLDPGGPIAQRWRIGMAALSAVLAIHIATACWRGARLRYFFSPFNIVWFFRSGWRQSAFAGIIGYAVSLHVPHFLWLGMRGFVGGLAWLLIPVSLMALGGRAPLLALGGAALLGIVFLYLPFLQMRFATENRFRALFELGAVRRDFQRAPWAFAFAFLLTLAFAVPLYLLKIEMIPREAAWLPSLVFIAFMYPARLLTGWAYGRAQRASQPRHWLFRWTARVGMLPVAALYVLIVYFTQFTAWKGVWSLYEQHAFLLPVPFMNM